MLQLTAGVKGFISPIPVLKIRPIIVFSLSLVHHVGIDIIITYVPLNFIVGIIQMGNFNIGLGILCRTSLNLVLP